MGSWWAWSPWAAATAAKARTEVKDFIEPQCWMLELRLCEIMKLKDQLGP